jgi:hypothetical protein
MFEHSSIIHNCNDTAQKDADLITNFLYGVKLFQSS